MRKLLSLACLSSLLFLPALVLAQIQQPSTWGLLKSRYGQEDRVDSPSRFHAVEQAILSDPLLSDADLGRVGKLIQGSGFFGAGMRGGTQPFLVFVDDNYSVTRIISLEDIPGLSPQISAVNLRTGEILWTSPQESASKSYPNRTQLRPEGATLQSSLCSAVAGAAAAWVATKIPPNPVWVAAVFAYVYQTVYDECIDIDIHIDPIYYEDIDPVGPGENKYENKPQPGGR